VATWEASGSLDISLEDGEVVTLRNDDLNVRIQQREGTASAFDENALVAIDTHISDDLLLEGVAREVINRIQGLRKDLDLAYDDRISLSWDGGPSVVEALELHHRLIADEVLAVQFQRQQGLQVSKADSVRGEPLAISLEVATP
jgi:isoleucyl-tRNA synthetase